MYGLFCLECFELICGWIVNNGFCGGWIVFFLVEGDEFVGYLV